RLRQRQPLLRGMRDKRLPAKAFFQGGNGACWAVHTGEVVAGFLKHPLRTRRRAAAPTNIVRVPLALRFPGNMEPALHPLLFEHVVNRCPERSCRGALTLAPPSRWR